MGKNKSYVFGKFKSWLIGWVKLFCAVVVISTFGFIVPEWDTDLIGYFLLKMFE